MLESNRHNNTRTGLLAALALAALLSACATPTGTDRPAVTDRSALRLEQAGHYEAAARQYLALAGGQSEKSATDYRLRAVSALLEANAADKAARILKSLGVPTDKRQFVRYRLAEAEVARVEHREGEALAVLGTLANHAMTRESSQQYYLALARVHEQAGDLLAAARERVALGLLIRDEREQQKNRLAIWSVVMKIDPRTANTGNITNRELAGWLALANHVQLSLFDSNEFEKNIHSWRLEWPGHPGDMEITSMLTLTGHQQSLHPRHIGLLLPFSGTYAGPAAAVRDGFLAAWFNDQNNAQQPEISLYDSDPANIWQTLSQAVNDGVDFIVGPLDKKSVTLLQSSERLPVTTLALNQAELPPTDPTVLIEPQIHRGPDNLYKFGLLPEDEARQAAQFAWFEGHVKAAVIVPDNDWGIRLSEAFSEHWNLLGGEVVEIKGFTKDARNMAATIKDLLNIDDSRQRINALKLRLNTDIESETRRRQDIDFVFLAAFPKEARQLRPQLSFHKAADIPVYATSHIYSGSPNKETNRDMNGVYFSDMPWVLDTDRPEYSLQKTIDQTWPESSRRYRRLYALGVDAYAVIPHLVRLRAQPFSRYEGETGGLSVSSDAMIHRQLTWARFRNGLAQIVSQ